MWACFEKEASGLMERKPFMKPALKEEASLTEVTLVSDIG